MRIQGLTLGRGLLRAYLVLWLLWALFLAFSSHKALLTAIGVTFWTPESVMERSRLDHEAEYKELNCDNQAKKNDSRCFHLYLEMNSYPLSTVVTRDDAKFTAQVFFYTGFIIPVLILLAGFPMWFLLRWIIRGFMGSDKN